MLDRRITILSNNRETLDGLGAYLRRDGARVTCISSLADAEITAPADAVIFFADDYPQPRALAAFAALERALPAARLVVVTAEVELFGATRGGGDASKGRGNVVVLRRPAWGWMFLDAIRGDLDSARSV